MEKKKILIIGAGIAGLSVGSYLVRNGFDTVIYEAHNLPGGVCTAWKRDDYTFDYCVHWLMGTGQGTGYEILWEELKALENTKGEKTPIKNFDKFTSIELKNGEIIDLYSDLDRLKEEFLRIAPEEEKKIKNFIRDLKILSKLKNRVSTEKFSIRDKMIFNIKNIIPLLKVFKYGKMTMEDMKNHWSNEKMQEIFDIIIPASWSTLSLIFGMVFQHIKAAGYPIGGSLPLARNIEREYLRRGGRIEYSCKVNKIIVENNKAIGIKLENGEEYFGDEIISAADGYSTIFHLLEGKYLTSKIKRAYEEYSLFPSSVYIGFGVDKDLTDYPHALVINLQKPLKLPDGSEHKQISLNIYNFDPTLAPGGKTVVTVLINTWKDEYWSTIAKKDYKYYKEKKMFIAEKVMEIIENKIPGFSAMVETIDVSTPYTVKRYTSNWHGSYEGFAPTPKALMSKIPKNIKGLDNFNMIGQWTVPGGGIPSAALDGRNLALRLCKKYNKIFNAF